MSLGTFRNDDANANEKFTWKLSSHDLYYFAIIVILSTSTMWANYPATEQVETTFKLRQRVKHFPPCACVLHKTLNLDISHCCLAEYAKEMHPNFKHTCTAFVFVLNPIVLRRSRCRRPNRELKKLQRRRQRKRHKKKGYNEKNKGPARALWILVHFSTVLGQTTTWND